MKVLCWLMIGFFSLSCPGISTISAVVAAEVVNEFTSEEPIPVPIPIYSKEVLLDTLNNIRGKLLAGFPATTELIFLEDVRNEFKRQLAELEEVIEEELTDIPGEALNTDFEGVLDEARRLLYRLDNIIVNPSIDQIDAALELIGTFEPEPEQKDLLAARMELPDRAVGSLERKPALVSIETAITETDLAETDEIVFTDRIIEKAGALHNFVLMVSWVTANIKNEFYPGSMKTAEEVLVDGAGNAYGQCTLLIALFRAKDIPAKYVRGYKTLTIEQLMNWTGGLTPEAAIEIIEGNNNPIVERFYDESGNVEKVRLDHVFVAFYAPNKKWAIVDPSFKEYTYTEGTGFEIDQATKDALGETVTFLNEEETIALANYADIETIINEQAAIYDNNVSHIDEVLGTREISAAQKIIPPIYIVKGILTDEDYIEEFSAIPRSLQTMFAIETTVPYWWWEITNLFHMTPVAKLAGKRVSVYYAPVNQDAYDAAIDQYGNIYNVPNARNLFQMRPVLEIGGEVVAVGNYSTRLGDYHKSHTYFRMPGTSWVLQSKSLRAGNKYDLSIPTQETSLEEVKRLAEELQIVADESGLSPDEIVTDDMILEKLRLVGMIYFGAKGVFSEQIARRLGVMTTNHMSLGYICDEIKWNGTGVAKAGLHMDVVRNAIKVISTTGDSAAEKTYMGSAGWVSTGLEHAVINIAFGATAVSTGMMFTEAAKQGVPLHTIRPGHLYADLAGVTIVNPATRSHIVKYVNAGYLAIIPQRPIAVDSGEGSSWLGEGWQVINPVTGAAGYLICGGIVYGGIVEDPVLINGGSSATIIDHPLSKFELFLFALVMGFGPICSGLGHMVAADALYAYLATYAGYAAGVPMVLAMSAVGAALIAVGLAAFALTYMSLIAILNNSKRRRVYLAYA